MPAVSAQTCPVGVVASAISFGDGESSSANWKLIIRAGPRVKPGMGGSRKLYSSRGTLMPQKFKAPKQKREDAISDRKDAPSGAPAPEFEGFKTKQAQVDGNEAAARVAYLMSEAAFVFPITPSTPMAEMAEAWAAAGKENIFGTGMTCIQMESETGAAGALHGGIAGGAMATTFTCSQGLLLMVPNMFKIAGELTPCVMHVTARALAKHALSIYGDHQDVMAVRQTGWAMISSHNVQEAHDLALAAHLATLRSSIPFVHFFDGFRTSHEINSITEIPEEGLKLLLQERVYKEAIHRHRDRALNPMHPHQRGTAQGPDIYFQCCEAENPWYNACTAHVEAALEDVARLTGRRYNLFDYVGAPDAEDVVVVMGSASQAVEEAVSYLRAQGRKVGVLKVRMYRPWSTAAFMSTLPTTCQRICVLDRTKESGAPGEPLYMDISNAVREDSEVSGLYRMVIGGRYGLGSKEFTPAQAVACFDNLVSASPKKGFTVGITDDVTNLSLTVGPEIDTVPPGTTQCVFWGIGSDGTVGANKDAIKVIGYNTDLYAQAYFNYDAKKSGGVTVSHLRFGPEPINSTYLVGKGQADYLAVHMDTYLNNYNVLQGLRKGGTLVLNSRHTTAEKLEKFLDPQVRRTIADKGCKLYVIDARSVSELVGLGKRINMVMQTVFFSLANVLPLEKAIPLLKDAITKTYSRKGPEVVEQNHWVVDNTVDNLKQIEVPASWASESLELPPVKIAHAFSAKDTMSKWRYIDEVVTPVLRQEGDFLPVSVFAPDGVVPPGTTVVEKRSIAAEVPAWRSDSCTECNICSFVCPHAAIRPFLLSDEEAASAPAGFTTIGGKGKEISSFQYRIQVSPADCTGCNLCTKACPTSALVPTPLEHMLSQETANWDFATKLPERGNELDKRATVRGSQFMTPLLEFSGACEGCQETAYVKLVTQMFGDHLIMANATGCSSIWGGSAPSNPYTTNSEGYGPAWANSLFEDNAQFGLGISAASKARRKAVHKHVSSLLAMEPFPASAELKEGLTRWTEVWQDANACIAVSKSVVDLLEAEVGALDASGVVPQAGVDALWEIYEEKDQLMKPTLWIVGGDGWAYDIGFGGLDHVMASGENINILVLDTEMYSNTGGQRSKSTPVGSVAKLAAGGKETPKKDLGAIAISYGSVYVASVNLGANPTQVAKAISEAEAYDGVSLIIGYAPCGLFGLEGGMSSAHEHCQAASESGYWPMYRYHPGEDGAMHVDTKHLKADINEVVKTENRFKQLARMNPELFHKLSHQLDDSVRHRLYNMKTNSANKRSNLPPFPFSESFDASEFAHQEARDAKKAEGEQNN
eukprot:CAMPEP_0117666264 /NCGR_PEP_ID=MMETSP0804-20121206/10277_1 /TAXON_ID=1074897 /ORGANISM="Tetraselmis astigmatica, Strain CCMP880" /LENGTH=1326 /DNA_ID=CAMNT_0005473785 /DNA_START=664 /DNA_END=4644 /DNA_ORIENTATION=+